MKQLHKKTKKEQCIEPTLCLSYTRLVSTTDGEVISIFSWKYGFLIHRYLGLNQFHQSQSPSGRLE